VAGVGLPLGAAGCHPCLSVLPDLAVVALGAMADGWAKRGSPFTTHACAQGSEL